MRCRLRSLEIVLQRASAGCSGRASRSVALKFFISRVDDGEILTIANQPTREGQKRDQVSRLRTEGLFYPRNANVGGKRTR
jgi:hypothetical protein